MRRTILANGEVYHVFNRSIELRPAFTDKREYKRLILIIEYYRFKNPPLRLSKALQLDKAQREKFFLKFSKQSKKLIEIYAYCIMPNHFHFLLKQKEENGISRFISNLTNSYTRYFNTKHKRVGPLFQGTFKAVRIENDEQLIHVSRYIHLNPISSFLIKRENLNNYPWSSLPEYLFRLPRKICDSQFILGNFLSTEKYQNFLFDQIDYAQKLEAIKHLTME